MAAGGVGTGSALYFASPFEPAPRWRFGCAGIARASFGVCRSHNNPNGHRAASRCCRPWRWASPMPRPGNARGGAGGLASLRHASNRPAGGAGLGSRGAKGVLDQVRSGRLPDPPLAFACCCARVEITLRIGQGVDLTAQLLPPPGPAAPGDSDLLAQRFLNGSVQWALPLAHPAWRRWPIHPRPGNGW